MSYSREVMQRVSQGYPFWYAYAVSGTNVMDEKLAEAAKNRTREIMKLERLIINEKQKLKVEEEKSWLKRVNRGRIIDKYEKNIKSLREQKNIKVLEDADFTDNTDEARYNIEKEDHEEEIAKLKKQLVKEKNKVFSSKNKKNQRKNNIKTFKDKIRKKDRKQDILNEKKKKEMERKKKERESEEKG